MQIENGLLSLSFADNRLMLKHAGLRKKVMLDFPAVAVLVNKTPIAPDVAGIRAARVEAGGMVFQISRGNLDFKVVYRLAPRRAWLTKTVHITGGKALPTPARVQLDRQSGLGDNLAVCGYRPSVYKTNAYRPDEESGGFIAGCGYPAIGREFFAGAAHPAAFCVVENGVVTAFHHPVWNDGALQVVDTVIGWASDARACFHEYLELIRLPRLKKPLIAFGNGYSAPKTFTAGGLEYAVTYDSLKIMIEGFQRLRLKPDFFSLDAGWYDKNSIYRPRAEIHGEKGLAILKKLATATNSKISLWVTHNGRLGFNREFLRKNKFAVGEGQSAAYCGWAAVMMDQRFQRAIKKRFVELVKSGITHFKIDFDNDCATNPDFADKYPTRDHVRQASINAYMEIAAAIRAADSSVVIRNGWWPSPWWLSHANHVWLANSGDMEYSSLPSDNPRESAMTHRDAMYYAILQRDRTPVPLDCFDNHELSAARHQPFNDTPGTWANALWMVCLRGNTYQPFMVSPQTLTAWQAEFWRAIMTFCRACRSRLYVDRARMVGGCPNHGAPYGFCHPGRDQTWLALRNPQAIPQSVPVDFQQYAEHAVRDVLMFYPHFERMPPIITVTLLPHEVRVFALSMRPFTWNLSRPVQPDSTGKKVYYPASAVVRGSMPMLGKIQRIAELVVMQRENQVEGTVAHFKYIVAAPYRMKDFKLRVKVVGGAINKIMAFARCNRSSVVSGLKRSFFQLPVARIPCGNLPSHGEERNPDLIAPEKSVVFTADIPSGGIFGLMFSLENYNPAATRMEAWLAGYEDRALTPVGNRAAAEIFNKAIPPQHPLGFGRALRLE